MIRIRSTSILLESRFLVLLIKKRLPYILDSDYIEITNEPKTEHVTRNLTAFSELRLER